MQVQSTDATLFNWFWTEHLWSNWLASHASRPNHLLPEHLYLQKRLIRKCVKGLSIALTHFPHFSWQHAVFKIFLVYFRKAIFRRIQHSESGIQTQVILGRFLKGQTQLKWHLGQVGPTEFESLLLKHFFLKITFQTFQHYVYTASRTELS